MKLSKLLRKIAQLFLFSLTLIRVSYAQVDSSNYYQFLNWYYQSPIHYNDSLEDEEGGRYEQIRRTARIWTPRLWPHGDLSIAANAYRDYANNFQASCANSNYISKHWSNIGPIGKPDLSLVSSTFAPMGPGRFDNIVFDPNYNGSTNKKVYACNFFGGLWFSSNAGNNWSVLNTDNQLPFSSVFDIAVDNTNDNNLFILVGNSDYLPTPSWSPNWSQNNPTMCYGVYRSANHGNNWQAINSGLINFFTTNSGISDIEINPQNNNEIIVASSEGLFKCNNALASTPSWSNVFTNLTGFPNDKHLFSVKYKPTLPSTIYAGGQDIYQTLNGGTTWSSMTGPGTGLDFVQLAANGLQVYRCNLATTSANINKLFAFVYFSSGSTGIYVYDGTQWSLIYSGNSHPDKMGISGSHISEYSIFFDNSLEVWGSLNYTVNPMAVRGDYNSGLFHGDVHGVQLEPNVSSPRLFCATDGGVIMLDQLNLSPSVPTQLYNDCSTARMWSFDDSEKNKNMIVVALQDDGSQISDVVGGINKTYQVGDFGDGYNSNVVWDEDDVSYISFSRRYNYATNNLSTESWPIDPTAGYAVGLPSSDKVYNHPQTNDKIVGLAELFKRGGISSGAPIWEVESDIGKIEPADWKRKITEFEIAESNSNYAYIAIGGVDNGISPFVEPRIFRTTTGLNAGNFSVNKFSEITNNLPSTTFGANTRPVITGIAVAKTDAQKLWVSFTGFDPDLKVWFSNDAGNTWQNADPNHCLANIPVNGIVFQDGTNDRLYIATDAGVFTHDNSSNDWFRYGDIPNTRIMELKINNCTGRLRACAYGRSVWETDLMPSTGYNSSFEINSNTTWTTTQIITRNLRIKSGATLTLQNAILMMPKQGKILIDAGGTLVVDGGTITNNCDQLWEGIQIDGPTANLVVINNATIKNANTAINTLNGGVFRITNSTLTQNFRHIHLEGAMGVYSGSITGSTLSCSVNVNTKGAKTINAIEIVNCENVTIGNDLLSASTNNILDWESHGLLIDRSNVQVVNNIFAAAPNGILPKGIRAINTTSKTFRLLVGVPVFGTNTATAKNKFNIMDFGVLVANQLYIPTIENNDFLNISKFGIIVTNAAKDIRIRNNYIYNSDNLIYGIRVVVNPKVSNINIEANRITGNKNITSIGIYVAEGSLQDLPRVTIISNDINKCLNGIYVANEVTPLIQSNTILFNDANSNNSIGTGINAANCIVADIEDNIVNTTVGISKPFYGINAEQGSSPYICNNTLLTLQRGIQVKGKMFGTKIKNNIMDSNYYGFCLSNQGDIGEQGADPDNPSDNQWLNNTYDSYAEGFSNLGSPTTKFFTRNQPNYDIVTFFNVNSINILSTGVANLTPPFADCSDHKGWRMSHQIQTALSDTIPDSTLTETELWVGKKSLYELALRDTSVDTNNVVIASFISATEAQPEGIFSAIETDLGDAFKDTTHTHPDSSKIMAATVKNQGVSDVKLVDFNKKIINTIYLETIARDIFEFTPQQSDWINFLAPLCPFEAGPAVYQAMAMSYYTNPDAFYDNSTCDPNASLRKAGTLSNQQPESFFHFYPNPVKDQLYVDYIIPAKSIATIQLCDISGKNILSQSIYAEKNQDKISLNKLSAGIYFCKAILNNKIILTQKITVAK